MRKLAFLPPPLNERFQLVFSAEQAASLGLRKNYILNAVLIRAEGQEPCGPPLLLLSSHSPHSWPRLFTASFTLNNRPGDLSDLLRLLTNCGLQVKYLDAAQGGSTTLHKRAIFPNATVIFEVARNSPHYTDFNNWINNPLPNLIGEMQATKAIQAALNGGIKIDWLSPVTGQAAAAIEKGYRHSTGMGLERDMWSALRVEQCSDGSVAVSLAPIVQHLFPEVRYHWEFINGNVPLPYQPFVAADFGDQLIVVHHLSIVHCALLELDVWIPASGNEDQWIQHFCQVIGANRGNILGVQTEGKYEGIWLLVKFIVQFNSNSTDEAGESRDRTAPSSKHFLIRMLETLFALDRHHNVMGDGTNNHLNRSQRVENSLPPTVGARISHPLPRRRAELARVRTFYNAEGKLVHVNGQPLECLFNSVPFDPVSPLSLSKYELLYGAGYVPGLESRRALAGRIASRLRTRATTKLAIIGSHRVGKSTVLSMVEDYLRSSQGSNIAYLSYVNKAIAVSTGGTIEDDLPEALAAEVESIETETIPIVLRPSIMAPERLLPEVKRQLERPWIDFFAHRRQVRTSADPSQAPGDTPERIKVADEWKRVFASLKNPWPKVTGSSNHSEEGIHTSPSMSAAERDHVLLVNAISEATGLLQRYREDADIQLATGWLVRYRFLSSFFDPTRLATLLEGYIIQEMRAVIDNSRRNLLRDAELLAPATTGWSHGKFVQHLIDEWWTHRVPVVASACLNALKAPTANVEALSDRLQGNYFTKMQSAVGKRDDRHSGNDSTRDTDAGSITDGLKGEFVEACVSMSVILPELINYSTHCKLNSGERDSLKQLVLVFLNNMKKAVTAAVHKFKLSSQRAYCLAMKGPASTGKQSKRHPDNRPRFAIIVDSLPSGIPWTTSRGLQAVRANIERNTGWINWLVGANPIASEAGGMPLGELSDALYEYNLGVLPEQESARIMERLGAPSSDFYGFLPTPSSPTKLMTRPYLSPRAKDALIRWTGRHPFLIQLCCYQLYRKATTRCAPIINEAFCRQMLSDVIMPNLNEFFERHWSDLAKHREELASVAEQFTVNEWLGRLNDRIAPPRKLEMACAKALDRACLYAKADDAIVPLFALWIRGRVSRTL